MAYVGKLLLKLAGAVSDVHGAYQCILAFSGWIGGLTMAAWLWFCHQSFWVALPVAVLPGIFVGCCVAGWNHRTLRRKSRQPRKTTRKASKTKGTTTKAGTGKSVAQLDESRNLRFALRIVIGLVFLVTLTMPLWKHEISASGELISTDQEARLQKKYPLGYVVFDTNGNRLGPMRFHPSEAILQADWREARVEVDRAKKVAKLTIPGVTWKFVPKGGIFMNGGNLIDQENYIPGQAVEIMQGISFGGKPRIFLEMFDDSGSVPQCVLGFK